MGGARPPLTNSCDKYFDKHHVFYIIGPFSLENNKIYGIVLLQAYNFFLKQQGLIII